MVIVIDKGRVKWVGSPTDLSVSTYSSFSPLNELDTDIHTHEQESSMGICIEEKQELVENNTLCATEEAKQIIEEEVRKEGRVELTVYK